MNPLAVCPVWWPPFELVYRTVFYRRKSRSEVKRLFDQSAIRWGNTRLGWKDTWPTAGPEDLRVGKHSVWNIEVKCLHDEAHD